MPHPPRRTDLALYNEACAFSILDRPTVETVAACNADDESEVLDRLQVNHRIVLMELVQDDPFSIRVLVDGELIDDERNWIARATVPFETEGDVLWITGGFDPSVCAEIRDHGESELAVEVELRPGTWRADLYTYVTSVNADLALDCEAGERVGRLAQMFETTGDGAPWPRWLARLCHELWDDDGEHPIWDDPAKARTEGRLQIDEDRRPRLDFVLQLRPLDAAPEFEPTPWGEESMLEPGAGSRRPETLPTPPASDLESEDSEDPWG